MDLSTGKKSVRFSSPFERTSEPEATVLKQPQKRKILEVSAPTMEARSIGTSSDSSVSGDSWDAFDVKMMKSKVTPATTQVKNQFLEMSITQNKSLNVGDDDDFEKMPFQDAKELIERDEQERLQFLNSNLTFEGIDQAGTPSLLSLTSYFQQGSSFPVPYVGNDSTMMFGGGLPPGVSSYLDPELASETLRRFSTSSAQQYLHRDSSITRRSSTSKLPASHPNDSTIRSVVSEKSYLEKQNSLAKFFLGSEAQGLDKNGIMDHVLDYCKRRASFRDSDSSTQHSPDRDESITQMADIDPAASFDFRMDRGNEETVIDMRSKMNTKSSITSMVDARTKDKKQSAAITNDNQDESIVISSDRAAIMKTREGPLLNVSDMGTSEGFENFKRNLLRKGMSEKNGGDRYRDKISHRVEFEKKRLQIDERYSHPQLSPKALSGPGATASLERPSKRLICNSPPEKLVTRRDEPAGRNANIVMKSQEFQTPRMGDGQCHSTPVAVDSFIKRLDDVSNVSTHRGSRVERVSSRSSRRSVEPERPEGKKEDLASQDARSKKTDSSGRESASSDLSADRQSSGTQIRRKSPLTKKYVPPQPTQVVEPSNSTVSSNDASNSTVLKTSSAKAIPLPPPNLSVVPVIHPAGQQPHQQHFGGSQQCSCPHQCGQQSVAHGIPGMMQGLPIVIHIHLPGPTTTGAMVHQVPTPTTEAPAPPK